MVAVEVVLIIIGVVFVIGSFFVTEKLSQQDLEHISMMSEGDLKFIAEKQIKDIKGQIESSVEEIIEESLEVTKRGLEKETNKKIMAVSEYSDTVIETMNKTHNEIVFLYSMLNDKHAETAEIVGDLQKYAKQIHEFDMEAAMSKLEESGRGNNVSSANGTGGNVTDVSNSINIEETTPVDMEMAEDFVVETLSLNKNEKILLLHKEGMNEVEIAKALDCGLGEVRLVLGLYHEA